MAYCFFKKIFANASNAGTNIRLLDLRRISDVGRSASVTGKPVKKNSILIQ